MSEYLRWNDLLLSEFFSPASANEEVWLHTTRDELDAFGVHLGGAEGLVKAVSDGAPWLHANHDTCADEALVLVRQRTELRNAPIGYRDPGETNLAYEAARAPTYLPILALWVLASFDIQQEGGFYAGVSKYLGRPFPNSLQVRDAMLHTWRDLELWSSRTCAGKFGVFRTRVLGEHRFVGIPRSQSLVSRSDARNMARLFLEFRLRPGQQISDVTLRKVLERGKDSNFLSRALKSAMGKPEYAEPLRSLVVRLLANWDGRRPQLSPTDAGRQVIGGPDSDVQSRSLDTLMLALSPSDEVMDGWDISWRFPATADMSSCFVELYGQRLSASIEQGGGAFITNRSTENCRAAAVALMSSSTSPVDVRIYFDEDCNGGAIEGDRRAQIAMATKRILSWNTPDPRFGAFLAERDIPLFGPVYLVCSGADQVHTEPWLQREGIAFQPVPATGLPDGWWMACIERAEALSAEQRQQIADSPQLTDVPEARVRLVGGRPLIRGGARVFAAYDLPLIDVEGPPGSQLEAIGLQLKELGPTDQSATRASARRFVIEGADPARSVFEAKVVCDHRELVTAKLRIAGIEGEKPGEARAFSLSRLGISSRDCDGLRGLVIGAQLGQAEWPEPYKLPLEDFSSHCGCEPQDSAAAKFLDSLSSLGSIGFGLARDQIRRLTERIEPIPLLMDLRARGCIEIQTDIKGHVVRVHSVPPTLYELPITFDGLSVFGVGGSMMLRHWSMLSENGNFLTSLRDGQVGSLPVLRLAAIGTDTVREACESMGFQFVCRPAEAIAAWAGSVQDAKENFASGGMERYFAELNHLHRLKPDSAKFVPDESEHMSFDPQLGAQLFRFDDPQASTMQIYMLGSRTNSGSRYSHIHDSRWGVWISQLAFAQMLRDQLGMSDACPWPVQYDPIKRDIWLPARLRPPAVLERVLAVCSGFGPGVYLLSTGIRVNGRLAMVDESTGRTIGNVSLVYEGFLPGYWLRYRCVPVDLAGRIASQLGGAVDLIAGLAHRVKDQAVTA